MARSNLTRRFTSYNIAKYEKSNETTITEMIGMKSFTVGQIMKLIQLGNNNIKEEEAGDLLDNYLKDDDEHNLLSAYIDVLNDLDIDIKILKMAGISAQKLKEDLQRNLEDKQKEAVVEA